MSEESIGLAFALANVALLAFCAWLEEHRGLGANDMDLKQFKPFEGFTLEDIIRHLSNWSMPKESEMAQNELLVAILLLCREWNRTHL